MNTSDHTINYLQKRIPVRRLKDSIGMASIKTAVFLLVLHLAASAVPVTAAEIEHLSAIQAKAVIEAHATNQKFVILDVRTPREYSQGHIKDAILLDFYHPDFENGLRRLERSNTYLLYCRSGNRSGRVLKLFEKLGFGKIYHLAHGINAWRTQKLPLVKP